MQNIMDENSLKNQYFATFCANIISLAHGAVVGWTSPFLPILQSNNSPLKSGPITTEEASWIGSLLCVGALVGTPIFGWTVDKFGRKKSACFMAVPQILSWICILGAQSVVYLFVSRFLAGIAAGGMFVVIPLYVTEISDPKIRGALGSIMIFSLNIGTLLCFIAGAYLNYFIVQLVLLCVPVLYFVCFIFLPETPYYLLKNNRFEEAEQSLRYFRGQNGASIELSDQLKKDFNDLTHNSSDNTTNNIIDDQTITTADFKSKIAIKSIVFGIGLVGLNQFSGCFALINYTAQIFEEAKTGLDPNLSAIVVGIIQIFGSYGATYLVDKAGRKILYLVSAIGSGVGLTIMGVFAYLKMAGLDLSAFQFIPVASLSFVIFIASVGILPLAFIIVSELSPPKIRGVVTSLCMEIHWMFAFIVIKTFAFLIESLGMYGCMWIFAGFCFTGFLLFGIFVPETKGKSFEEISLAMGGIKQIN